MDSKVGHSTFSLEIMLRAWEDRMFLTEMNGKLLKARGLDRALPLAMWGDRFDFNNWRMLRKRLLHVLSAQEMEGMSDRMRFGHVFEVLDSKLFNPFDTEQSFDPVLRDYYAQALLGWEKYSRRVFCLSADLQALINATSLEDIAFNQVHLPFESFVLELSQPIESSFGQTYSSLLLFPMMAEGVPGWWYCCMLIAEEVQRYQPIDQGRKQKIEELVRQGHWLQVERHLRGLDKHINAYKNMHLCFEWPSDSPIGVEEAVARYIEGVTSAAHKASRQSGIALAMQIDRVALQACVRILAGLSLYLRSLPSASRDQPQWVSQNFTTITLPGKVITEEVNVCLLSTEYVLAPEERTLLSSRRISEEILVRAGGFKSAHFRRGFWRRPPGQGQNPQAEKTVWVKPTVINRHLLKPGELPLGARQALLPITSSRRNKEEG